MVSLVKYGDHQNKNVMEFVCRSTDTKPTKTFNGMAISNGSKLLEMDTNKTFIYDEEKAQWHDIT